MFVRGVAAAACFWPSHRASRKSAAVIHRLLQGVRDVSHTSLDCVTGWSDITLMYGSQVHRTNKNDNCAAAAQLQATLHCTDAIFQNPTTHATGALGLPQQSHQACCQSEKLLDSPTKHDHAEIKNTSIVDHGCLQVSTSIRRDTHTHTSTSRYACSQQQADANARYTDDGHALRSNCQGPHAELGDS